MIDIVGQTYGKLTVVERLPSSWVRCKCRCGAMTEVRISNLRCKRPVKSCGKCKRSEPEKFKVDSIGKIRAQYHKGAMRRGIDWSLSYEQVKELVSQPCTYCGIRPIPRSGIDRVDSSMGYVEGNVVSCCTECNRAKNVMSVDEYRRWLVRAYKFMIRKEVPP